jgi:MFS family permease
VIVVLAVLHCLAFIDRTMIGGALPLMRLNIAMSDAQAGWVIGTAFALPYGVTALALAAILRGRRASLWWLVAGLVLWTAASLATGTAHSIGALTLARAALGVGQAMFVPVAISWLIDDTSPKDRARALSLFTSGSTIGRSVALLTVGALLSVLAMVARAGDGTLGNGSTDWRWLYAITALPNLLTLPFLVRVGLRPPRSESATGTISDMPPCSEAVQIDWGTLALFFAVAIMPVLVIQAIGGWLPSLFVRDRGLTPAHAAMLLGAVTLVAAPAGQITGGWLMTRYTAWHDRIPVIVLAGLAATLLPLAAVIWAPGLGGAIAGVAIANISLGIASFAGLFGVQMLTPQSHRVTVNAVFLALVTLIGVGVGPLLTGVLATSHAGAIEDTSLGVALFLTAAIACGLCAIAVGGVDRRYRLALR